LALAGIGIFLDQDITLTSFIGLNSVVFAIIYFVALNVIFKYQQQNTIAVAHSDANISMPLKSIVLRYLFFAVIIIAAALFLPKFADQIAEYSGLGKTFVGTLFLAASTSLPELAVSIAAVRLGSIDMAVGNLLGSNIFNVFILFLDDLFYQKGHLLKDAAESHLVSVFSVLIMTGIVIVGITFKARGKRFWLAWDTLLILIVYILNLILLHHLSQ
jgi:cation:H+ antiporter